MENARRFETLDGLADRISRASLYIGNDSGITHLAAACGVPTLAIFTGASDPAVWAPRGRRVVVLERPSAEDALKAGIRLLER